jgi:serine/threonine-protein kinase
VSRRLRIGARLGLGRVHPLGGGLFTVLTRRGPHRARHRLRAALVTAVLVAAAGTSWAATREPATVEQAQAAGAAPAAEVPAHAPCSVRYELRRDSGSTYEAVLTVSTPGEQAHLPWRAQFTYPGSQRLTAAPKAVTQRGRTVVAMGDGKLRTFTLRGTYRGHNPLPLTFTLDGSACRAEVLGTTTRSAESQQISEAAAPATRPTR